MLRVLVSPRFFGFVRRSRLGLLMLAVLAATATIRAEPAIRRHFDVPAGAALVTLKRAALQGELEIVYSAAVVEGVRTQAVEGDLTPFEALERKLANTALKIVQDPETKVFSVARRPVPDPRSLPQNPSPKDPSQTMKRKHPIAVIGTWLAIALGGTHSANAADGPSVVAGQSAEISGRVQNPVTGQYLNNARVSVRGTDLVAFTDQTGRYRLPQVPSGTVTLEVFYTGLDAQTATVQTSAGQTLARDFELTSASRYGESGVVKLDSFTVSTSRETDTATSC
jgi:hypothetical protein